MVFRPRFVLRGWNGEQASPVHDFSRILTDVGDRFGPVPSSWSGTRWRTRRPACCRASRCVAVAGLAPWLPPGEPVAQLAGRWICSRTAPPTGHRSGRHLGVRGAGRLGNGRDFDRDTRRRTCDAPPGAIVAQRRRRVHPVGPAATVSPATCTASSAERPRPLTARSCESRAISISQASRQCRKLVSTSRVAFVTSLAYFPLYDPNGPWFVTTAPASRLVFRAGPQPFAPGSLPGRYLGGQLSRQVKITCRGGRRCAAAVLMFRRN